MKSVKEKDVVAALTQLLDLLGDDVAQPAETKRAEAAAKGDTIASLACDRKAAARKAARNRDGPT